MSKEEKKCKHCGGRIAFFEGEWWHVSRSGERCGVHGMQMCVDLRKGQYLEMWLGAETYCVTPEPADEEDEDAA